MTTTPFSIIKYHSLVRGHSVKRVKSNNYLGYNNIVTPLQVKKVKANSNSVSVKPRLFRFKTGLINALFNARKAEKMPLVAENYDDLVLIDKKLPKRTVKILNNIKSTIGNFAKAHKLEVKFDAVNKNPHQFNLSVKQTVETPMLYVPSGTSDTINFSPIVLPTLPEQKLVLSKTMTSDFNAENETLARKIYKELDEAIKK